jgi:uncharacterized protein YjbI with pentapeptide repeats
MANPEHLAILKQGVEVWNKWRHENCAARPDLSGIRLVEFTPYVFSPAYYRPHPAERGDVVRAWSSGEWRESDWKDGWVSDLDSANLSECDLSMTDLSGAHFEKAILRGAKLRRANAFLADFVEADLSEVDFSMSKLDQASFRKSKVVKARFTEASPLGTSFEMADLKGSDFTATTLRGVNFSNSSLSQTKLENCYIDSLVFVDLRHAWSYGYYPKQTNRTEFNMATLNGANLRGAIVRNADLWKADLSSALLGNNSWDDVDLSRVTGLNSANHSGPSTVGIDTIYRSKGDISEVFLRGAGVPENFVAFMKSLTGAAFEFYSCFISYSTRDHDFGNRLHADLQNKGVRCWFAPHNIQGGKKIHEQIDDAIRINDRLLVILSDHSMNSEWVKTEIANVRQREIQERANNALSNQPCSL